ncbi:DUF2599 domain-containing protein [Agromyces soli]|uniref:DUF2599 domain-containing protein n=1 Tax=Agromyces soli TaxID=659012 RepID=A0ABY4AVZ0_9MICO|nr:DUF2599 domain-containing protein [Agromyces soli]UOE27340.1 DUF2599 domain-containing protein [Agromyces soli]
MTQRQHARPRVALAAGLSATTFWIFSGATLAYAEPPELGTQDAETIFAAVAPDVLKDVAEVEIVGGAVEYTDNGVTTQVPLDPREVVRLSTTGDEVGLSIPFGDQAELVETSDPGVIAYENGNGSRTALIVHDDSSIQIGTIIQGTESPHRYEYSLSIPAGGLISLDPAGSITILNGDGDYIAGVARPWAVDAQGNAIATRYEVRGTSLTQVVDHSADAEYPIVADPWLGSALISKAVWAKNLWKYSPTLKVYPTQYGRAWGAPGIARWAAWSETLSKTPRAGWPNPATASMENQFYCHFDVVRFRAPNKEYWGLDSKIPNRGYAGFLKTECN